MAAQHWMATMASAPARRGGMLTQHPPCKPGGLGACKADNEQIDHGVGKLHQNQREQTNLEHSVVIEDEVDTTLKMMSKAQ